MVRANGIRGPQPGAHARLRLAGSPHTQPGAAAGAGEGAADPRAAPPAVRTAKRQGRAPKLGDSVEQDLQTSACSRVRRELEAIPSRRVPPAPRLSQARVREQLRPASDPIP